MDIWGILLDYVAYVFTCVRTGIFHVEWFEKHSSTGCEKRICKIAYENAVKVNYYHMLKQWNNIINHPRVDKQVDLITT